MNIPVTPYEVQQIIVNKCDRFSEFVGENGKEK